MGRNFAKQTKKKLKSEAMADCMNVEVPVVGTLGTKKGRKYYQRFVSLSVTTH